ACYFKQTPGKISWHLLYCAEKIEFVFRSNPACRGARHALPTVWVIRLVGRCYAPSIWPQQCRNPQAAAYGVIAQLSCRRVPRFGESRRVDPEDRPHLVVRGDHRLHGWRWLLIAAHLQQRKIKLTAGAPEHFGLVR